MIAIIDVHYSEDKGVAACLVAEWTDKTARQMFLSTVSPIADYQPGHFYKRELPCIIQVLEALDLTTIEAIVIDGYVWLDADGGQGLGAYLYDALDEHVPIIGVAKNAFGDANFAVEILRGESARPLYVTAAKYDPELAAEKVVAMHGEYRIPTLLREVDQACRQGIEEAAASSSDDTPG